MVTVKIDDELLLNILTDRVRFWTDDPEILELYEKMYSNYIDSGVFEGCTFDVMDIVDNDYVNYCHTVCEGDKEFDEVLKVFKEQGCGDCSCELDECDYIEAANDDENPTIFLVR